MRIKLWSGFDPTSTPGDVYAAKYLVRTPRSLARGKGALTIFLRRVRRFWRGR